MIKLLTSWDDGSKYDLKLAELLKKYKIPAVFFIPTCSEMGDAGVVELSKDFEMGGHTVTHPADLKRLDRAEKLFEIEDNKVWLEDLCCYPLRWFAYPRGRYDNETMEIVRKAGFKYGRTTIVNRISNIHDYNCKIDTSLHIFDRDEYDGKDWLQYAKKYIEEMDKRDWDNGQYLHIWGHSEEIEANGYWEKLEELFKWMRKNFKIKPYETLTYK